MSYVHHRGPAKVEANLTPMIDVTFLLIVFFVLVSQIVEVENVDMELPVPESPRTEMPGDEQRAVVNVVPGRSGRAQGYRVGTRGFPAGDAGLAALRQHLAGLLANSPNLMVNLRADRATHYDQVEPVLEAIAEASRGQAGAGGRINLVVIREDS